MQNTKIEWAHHTFNPWIGCSKVSAGCANCYAENLMDKRFNKAKWGISGTRVKTSAATWEQPLRWNREAEKLGIRYRVFCASLADVFEDRPALAIWRAELFDLIHATPHLDWLLLTKRPENILPLMRQAVSRENPEGWFEEQGNVWLGTSVENQEQADKRIPELLKVPAKVRFLSCEPLLGEVDITPYLLLYNTNYTHTDGKYDVKKHNAFLAEGVFALPEAWALHWVIVGGESGPGARPMHPDWVDWLRDQCNEAAVPFFFKQWGDWTNERLGVPTSDWGVLTIDGEYMSGVTGWNGRDIDDDTREASMRCVGKRAAGRLLDGREWNEVPEPREWGVGRR